MLEDMYLVILMVSMLYLYFASKCLTYVELAAVCSNVGDSFAY